MNCAMFVTNTRHTGNHSQQHQIKKKEDKTKQITTCANGYLLELAGVKSFIIKHNGSHKQHMFQSPATLSHPPTDPFSHLCQDRCVRRDVSTRSVSEICLLSEK